MPTDGPSVASSSVAPIPQLARWSIRPDNKQWDGRSVVPAHAVFRIRSIRIPKHPIKEHLRQAPPSYIVHMTCDNGLFGRTSFGLSTSTD